MKPETMPLQEIHTQMTDAEKQALYSFAPAFGVRADDFDRELRRRILPAASGTAKRAPALGFLNQ